MKLVEYIIILLPFVILANGATFLEPNCGISKSTPRRSLARIHRGQVADMFGNPWMAYVKSTKYLCCGSLITNRFVLTAGHCVSNYSTTVYLGYFDVSSPTNCSTGFCLPGALRVPVDRQIAHPRYVNHFNDDIGLLRLVRTVEFTDYIRPVCLLTSPYPLNTLKDLTVTGWGRTETWRSSNILRTHTLQQQDLSYCARQLQMTLDISHICATNNYSNSCFGDSGSPVMAPLDLTGTPRMVQFGVVSTILRDCNSAEVYTNVMHHMEWIREVVRQDSQRAQYPRCPCRC